MHFQSTNISDDVKYRAWMLISYKTKCNFPTENVRKCNHRCRNLESQH